MKRIKFETDKNILLMMCDALLMLNEARFQSADQRTKYMSLRYHVAPKLMRHMVKEPVSNSIRLSYIEADLVVFANKEYRCRSHRQEGFCRQILMQLEPKILKVTDCGPPILIESNPIPEKETNPKEAEPTYNKFRWILP